MKPSLRLSSSQQLKITPQLQQAIAVLQLSSLELQQEVQQKLYSNPLLELEESEEEKGEPVVNPHARRDGPAVASPRQDA